MSCDPTRGTSGEKIWLRLSWDPGHWHTMLDPKIGKTNPTVKSRALRHLNHTTLLKQKPYSTAKAHSIIQVQEVLEGGGLLAPHVMFSAASGNLQRIAL